MLTDIDYQTAQKELLQQVIPVAAQDIPLTEAFGRITCQDLIVPFPIPSGPQSATDGFALNIADLDGAGPLRIVNLNYTDIADYQLQKGETVPVNTGFRVPRNTGAVIPHERVVYQGEYILIRNSLKPGSNIKQAGEDFQAGDLLAVSGSRLTAGLISAAAACGLTSVSVYRKPRVGILNLSPYHSSKRTDNSIGLLPDSNGPLLASLITRDGGEVKWVADQGDKNLAEISTDTDLLLTTGGTYAKGKSEAQLLLEELGATILFWGTRIQPGGHNGSGVFGSRLAICLSGNPAACAVGYELLAAPVMRCFQGLSPNLSRIPATCVNNI
jgi:molybdopterin molybdotransferase